MSKPLGASLIKSLAAAGITATALSVAVPAAAQDPTQTQAADQEVLVTGSRIARDSDFDSPSPVVTIDSAAIEKAGYSNLQQLMEKIPTNGNGTFSTRGNNQDSTANGAASISLRGLGADATLVLVNGRRVAISAFAENITTNFVDINAIPVSAIERVEVLKDGSSAVYGSDAVAGVVNIILRKDFEGFETSFGYGNTTESDYEEQTLAAIWGSSGENSNVTLLFDYFKNTSLFNSERGTLGSANQTAQGGEDFRSSRGYPGSFIVNGVPTRDPNCPAGSQRGANCVYDFGVWNVLTPEAERVGLMLLGRQGLGERAEFFTEIAVQHNTSLAQGAPTPLDDGALLTVPTTHPNNPFPGATSIAIRRYRTVDAGPRQWNVETDNLRAVVGLRGELADWDWEIGAQRARSESEQTGDRSQGWIRTDFLQQEINAGRYNPFGGVQNPQSVIDAITTNLVRRGLSRMTMYDAQISGKLFDMSTDAVRMAAGLEYRDESISDVPDDQFQRGLIFGTESISASGQRDSWSAFVEFSVPVVETVELSLAARYDDYSDFGNTTNPKVAVRWAATDNLALRASWGTGFRAPSLAQIGLGPSQESQFFVDTYGCADNPVYCGLLDYLVFFTGNPNLEAEESESFNIGAAWQSDRFNVSLDYWDLVQENKIDEAFGLSYIQNCNVQGNPLCPRGAPLPGDTLGSLGAGGVFASFQNIGEQSAKGVDLSGNFVTDLTGGRLTLGLTYSRLLDFERVEFDPFTSGFVARELTGEYEYPEDRALISADWQAAKWGVYGNVSYVGSFQDLPDIDFDTILDYYANDTRDVGSFKTLNLQFRYTGIENMKFLLGLDNALDEETPFAIGDGDTDLYGYVQSQHTPRGRFWNARAIFSF
ncbi:MAG: TonB-dependent receptor plug domain-containing protein [Gammaproteobacteria bacterium]